MFGNTQNSFDSIFVCRTKPIKAHQPKMCILYAQILVKPKKSILFAKALSPLALSPLPTPLPSWANVHPHSVAFSVSWVEQRVGFERGDIKACCKLRRGNLVVRITFWTFFARPNPYLSPCVRRLCCGVPVLWCDIVWCGVVLWCACIGSNTTGFVKSVSNKTKMCGFVWLECRWELVVTLRLGQRAAIWKWSCRIWIWKIQ